MKILKHLLSARFMAVLLFIMAIAIGIATFIENEYDTITAKVLVYNAKWFELVLLLLLLNFINNIKTYQLLKWKKWSVLLLHFGFIIALLGAFISRYIGLASCAWLGTIKKINTRIYRFKDQLLLYIFS